MWNYPLPTRKKEYTRVRALCDTALERALSQDPWRGLTSLPETTQIVIQTRMNSEVWWWETGRARAQTQSHAIISACSFGVKLVTDRHSQCQMSKKQIGLCEEQLHLLSVYAIKWKVENWTNGKHTSENRKVEECVSRIWLLDQPNSENVQPPGNRKNT